jgi:hypothetical protein
MCKRGDYLQEETKEWEYFLDQLIDQYGLILNADLIQ